jgi:hypothetical protein
MADVVGEQDIWGTRFNEIVTGFAYNAFQMKEVVRVVTSNSWTEKYYRETSAELTGHTNDAVKGVPRLANFPHANPSWTLYSATQEKYALECTISWEDVHTDQFDVISRVLLKVARGVAYAIDTQIYTALLAATGNTTATAAVWDVVANAACVADIVKAMRLLKEDGYTATHLLVNPYDYSYLIGYIFYKGASAPSFGEAILQNGNAVQTLLGLKIIVSNAVTDDNALVVAAQDCGTWQSANGLTTATIEDKGIGYKVRAWEIGVLQVTNPNAICSITNTKT